MLILDTHAWIWYVTESDKLSTKALNAIQNEDVCGVSAISCWEIAMLVEKDRLKFNISIDEWLRLALEFDKVELIPLSPEIAVKATKLGINFHGDPADRIIAATAHHTNSILITKDSRISASGIIETLW